MPTLPILSGRFFARLRAFEIACPQCGELYSSERRHKHWRKLVKRRHLQFDPVTQVWRCPSCDLKLTLGIIAWRGHGKQLPPEDIVPTLDESKRMREMGDPPDTQSLAERECAEMKAKLGGHDDERPLEATVDSAPSAIVSADYRVRRDPVNALVDPDGEDDGDAYQ